MIDWSIVAQPQGWLPPWAMNRLSVAWTYVYHPVLSARGEAPSFALTVV